MKNEALKFLKKICKNRVKVTKRMVIFFLMTGGLLLSQVNFSETVDETKPATDEDKQATIKDLKNYDYPNSLHFVSVQYSEDDVKEYKDYCKYLDLLKEKIEYLKKIALEEANGNDKKKIKEIEQELKEKLKEPMKKLKKGNELISQKVSYEIEGKFKPKNSDKDKKIEEINNEYAKRMNEIKKLSSNFNNLGIDYAHSIAIGKGVEISGENGIAIGVDTLSGKDSISLGKASIASGEGNIAIGRDATLFSKTFKGKIGQQIANILNNPDTIVKFENDGDVEYKKTIVIGDGTKSSGNSNIAIGDNAVAMKKRLTLISLQDGGTLSNKNGAEIDARNWNDIAKQFYNPGNQDKRSYKFEAKPVENAIALGKNASAFADNVIAIGKGAISGFESAVSIGENADTEGKNSVAIGKNSIIFGESSVAIGEKSRTGKIKYVLKTIEGKDKVEKSEEFDTIEAAKQELEKKKDDLSKIYRIEVGGEESKYSVAIGKGSAVEHSGSVAIGADSLAVKSDGKSAFTDVDHASGETVSFGNSNKKRRLTNVADGKDSSDAVTVAQLQKAIADNKGGSGGSEDLDVTGDTKYITVTPSDDKGKKTYTVKFDDSKLTETIKGSDFTSNKSIQDMLDKKANLDATNVTGDNLTKWQATLGNGTIDDNGTGLVTGGTVYNYINPIKTQVNQLGTDLNGKLSDITINGDKYIKTEKASKGVYNLSLNKDSLETLINSKTADLAKNDAITNINKELDKKANKDASNLEDKDVENWQNKLGNGTVTDGDTKLVKGGTVFTYVNNSINTIKQELSTKATEDLAKKLDIDAKNITDDGVATLTTKLGTGAIEDDNKNLVTGGTVKKYITDEMNNINTKVSGKLSSDDVDVKGDEYITVNKDVQKPNHYSLVFDKDKLATDLDLSKNTKLTEQFNKYALLDGSNLTSDEFNLNVWQAKLGNGTIASGNTGLVKGGDIFNYVNNIKQELTNKSSQDLSNKLDKDGTNLDDSSIVKLTNKLSEGSNLTTPTNRLVTDTTVSEALKGKLNVDADNLSDKGVTNLTNKLGVGEVAENNTNLVTGGKVYEVKKELDNKYTTLNNQVTTNTNDISKLKTDVEDLKNTKQDITKINTKLGDIDNSITNINTKLDGKLDKTDLSIKGDKYIDVKKDNKFNYTLTFNKTDLEKDLDLTNNSSINNIFNTNIGDLKTKVESNTNNINSLSTKVNDNSNKISDLTTKVETNTKDITTLKQDMTKKLDADANNLSADGITNLTNKLSKDSNIAKPKDRLVTDKQVNTYLSRYNDALGVVDKKSTVALEKSELALGGVANAVAMANLVQVNSYSDYRHNLSAAYGYYGGSHALAVGFSGTNEERNFVYKLSGSVNNKGNLAFGVGAGVMLGDKDERLTTEYSTKLKTVEKDLVEANKKIKEYEERQKATDIKVKELERKLNQILNKH